MRTKTLLLTAALTAAGVATSMAQVYSVNMVGYINCSIPTGFSMVANQLTGSPDNQVVNLMPSPPANTVVSKFNAAIGGFDSITFVDGAWEGDDLAMTLGPGQGAFIFAETAFTQTFVGEVVLSSSVSLAGGFSIISSVLPQSLALTGAPNDGIPAAPVGLGFPIANGDEVYQYNAATGAYTANSFVDDAWEGDGGGSPPVPAICEAFFLNRTTAPAGSWTRNFVVGVD